MVNKCKIARRNINSAPNEVELMVFAEREIVPFLEEIFDTDAYYTDDKLNPTKSKLATIALIQGLGESYAISEYNHSLCRRLRSVHLRYADYVAGT